MINQEAQVANAANQIITLTAQAYAMGIQIGELSALWTNLSAATKLNNFPTAAASLTGGLGVPDTDPVTTNPINPTAAPGNLVNRALSANNVAGLLTFLQGLQSCINGSAVSANGAAAQLIALCL